MSKKISVKKISGIQIPEHISVPKKHENILADILNARAVWYPADTARAVSLAQLRFLINGLEKDLQKIPYTVTDDKGKSSISPEFLLYEKLQKQEIALAKALAIDIVSISGRADRVNSAKQIDALKASGTRETSSKFKGLSSK